ncbi:unnamed protein product [Laminaria digitata]
MGCLDESMPPSSSSTHGGAAASSASLHGEDGEGDTDKCNGNDVAALSERLVLEMAEIFSPKELHVMALAHLPAYTGERAVRAVLAALRRSTQRMPPLQRAKFLEAAIPPVIEATKRLAASADTTDPASSSDSEEEDNYSSGGGDHAHGLDVKQPPPPLEGDDNPPRAVYEAAASAAETANDFVGPLLEQACAEGALARDSEAAAAASAAAGNLENHLGGGERSAYPGAENAAASDLAVAAYTGFALSALEMSAVTSVCAAAAPAPAAAAAVSPSEAVECDNVALATKLAKAEQRLVELVMSSPAVDLPLVLLHGYRLSFNDRVEARGKGGGEAGSALSASCGSRGGLAGLAELAITGSSPWTLQGVSSFAYLVACEPRLRDRWLPLVWSRRTERRLFLPHAEVLMRTSSKRVARKGLELACFVGERLGVFPDETGASAFEWEQDGGEVDGEVDGAWVGRGDEDLFGEDEGTGPDATSSKGLRRQRSTFDPYYLDLVGFLQVLVDVMVSCPLPSLRARGHAAMSAFLTAAGEGSRFRTLKRLIERCPWPNATGLLLDAFRREVDRALRCQPEERASLAAASQDCGTAAVKAGAAGALPPGSCGGMEASPFASPLAGDFVCEQLRRACRKGSPASLLMDMDSRTGGFTLARYAHALDGAGGDGGNVGGMGGVRRERLMLREPQRLRDNQLLVEGFLGELRGAAITAASAGPDHFRLFILEDAAQQCLEELQR